MLNNPKVGWGLHNNAHNSPADLMTLLNSIPALVAYLDCNMVLQFCNQPFKTWFDLGEEVTTQTFPQIAGAEIFTQVQRHMGKVLVGDVAHFQISVNTQNGLQYLEATLSPDFDQRKKVKGFIFHCSDITEKNKTERALKDYFEKCLHLPALGECRWYYCLGKYCRTQAVRL